MKPPACAVALIASFACFAPAARAEDLQLRMLLHRPPRAAFDIAGWAIAPDITAHPPKGFALLGVGVRNGHGWAEALIGRFVAEGKKPQSAANCRSLFRTGRTTIYLEGMYREPPRELPTAYRQTYRPWVAAAFVTFSVTDRLALGLEGDELYGRGVKPSLGIGPRAVVKLDQKTSIAVGWQMRNAYGDTNFVRLYALRAF
ncbi:MAG: hypothetical protein AAB759_01845 [Patescibacteria group bacterium]